MQLDLFVYGTLMPGHLRWPMLAPHAIDQRKAETPGRLFDTGNGWPAGLIGPHADAATPGTVPGWVISLDLDDPEGMLARLDAMEGIGPEPDRTLNPYERIAVNIDGEQDIWAYTATWIDPAWTAVDAWHGRKER